MMSASGRSEGSDVDFNMAEWLAFVRYARL